MQLWDVSTGQMIRSVQLPAAGVPSPDLRMWAAAGPSGVVRLWEIEKERFRGALVALRDDQYLVLNADGHYRGTPRVERHLIYVVQTDQGQETLSPEEFAQRYGWRNDPKRVNLIGP